MGPNTSLNATAYGRALARALGPKRLAQRGHVGGAAVTLCHPGVEFVGKRVEHFVGVAVRRVEQGAEIGGDRVGIRISPVTPSNDASDSDPQPLFEHVARQLAPLGLAYVHVVEGQTGGARDHQQGAHPFDYAALRAAYRDAGGRGAWMVNNGYSAELAQQALDQGADIVITGRVADAALFLGPLVHALGWKLAHASTPEDFHRLAQGLTVGHLLECSGQGSGGNFGSQGSWQNIPDLAHMGYPIAEVWPDGTAYITKAPDTGGLVNFDTVRQQLLYEVHNPHAYFSPDVVLDMGQIQLHDEGQNRVRLSGAQGSAPTNQLKVVAGFRDGFKADITWGFSWPDAWDKVQAAERIIREQLRERKIPFDELFVEYPGLNSAHGALAPLPPTAELNERHEIWVRMVLRTPSKAAADGFGRLFPWMALSGPAYTCGFQGLNNTSELLGIWPTLIDRHLVKAHVEMLEAQA